MKAKQVKAKCIDDSWEYCKSNILLMLKRSQTKVIFPIITLGLLRSFITSKQTMFSDGEVKHSYENAVRESIEFLGHDLHVGGKYYDAYPMRNLPKYGVLRSAHGDRFELTESYCRHAVALVDWIPLVIKDHIELRLGQIPALGSREDRIKISESSEKFTDVIKSNIDKNPTNFEVFSFAVIKIHLEKFACKIYRDTRTSATDQGVDISTNFGVVYQIKKLKLLSQNSAEKVYDELKSNFDTARLTDGNIILIIDDISKSVRTFLIDMKVQSITKAEIISLAEHISDSEDREKVLRIVYEEIRREYSSNIKKFTPPILSVMT